MLHKTRGIVLGHINYRETSIIAKVFTEEFGLRSYIVNGVKGSRKGSKMAYFQSLSILDMIVYENESRDLQRISDMRLFLPFESIPFVHNKVIIAMFLAELLLKCLKEESPNREKFNFLTEQIALLDKLKTGVEDFHILFMLKLSSFLGFEPNSTEDFRASGIAINAHQTEILEKLFDGQELPRKGYDRSIILDILIKYYQFHIDNFGSFKSINVLREIVHN